MDSNGISGDGLLEKSFALSVGDRPLGSWESWVNLGRRVFLETGCRRQSRDILTGAHRRFGVKTHNFPKEFRWSP
jgi:hypothetical protein